MDHVGVIVEDLADAIAFFVELGLELKGETEVEGEWVDRVVGLEGVRSRIAMLRTPDGQGCIELAQFLSPPPNGSNELAPAANAAGIRHVTFLVDDVDDVLARLRTHGAELVGTVEPYRDIYKLCYVRGPAGIIVELAQQFS
jgi:catechol 2,3-dioxygenase-like lactoylglutathione lyase family enzyme